jgi:hypothetical protein
LRVPAFNAEGQGRLMIVSRVQPLDRAAQSGVLHDDSQGKGARRPSTLEGQNWQGFLSQPVAKKNMERPKSPVSKS